MTYIKEDANGVITLAGEVANQDMLDDGYYDHLGIIPDYDPSFQHLELVGPDLVVVDDVYEAALKAYEDRKAAMLEGAIYTLNTVDYAVSLTSDDANGVMQVHLATANGLLETIVTFKNGTALPLTAVEVPLFVQWFTDARNAYFLAGMQVTKPVRVLDSI